MQKTVGITGGIGSGKSIVARILQLMGYPVYASDQRAKELMHENPLIISGLKKLFGEEAYHDSHLNRPFIAAQIFRDESLRMQMNQLVHPAVREDFQQWVKQQKSPLVFQESALLFETGGYKLFDAVVLVTAPEHIRMERIKERDQLNDEQVRARFKAQMPEEEKMKLTNLVIQNDGNQLIVPQVLELIKQMS